MDFTGEALQELFKLNKQITELRAVLRVIAELGGNLPDDRLTSKTGANDAAHRGLMYCEARRIAREALEASK